jgi:hypothetical protein
MYAVIDCPDREKLPTSIDVYEHASDAYEAFVALVVEDMEQLADATADVGEVVPDLQTVVRENYPTHDECYDCGCSYIAIISTGVTLTTRAAKDSFSAKLAKAREVVRPPIKPGDVLEFHSTLQGEDGNGVWVREYSGQKVTVLQLYECAEDQDEPGEDLWAVQAADGVEFSAWETELNGFIAETGQTVWPLGQPAAR